MSFKTIQIRLFLLSSLVFFSLLLLISCGNKSENKISILWENDLPVSLHVQTELLDNPDLAQLNVRLASQGNEVPILGELQENDQGVLFTPLIPFTRGKSYEVLYNGTIIGMIAIPGMSQKDGNLSLLEIYPTQDTLPENQLKLFLKFSESMREGESLAYVTLLNSEDDTLKGVFLDLQPELWNGDQTMLTVWLDPGRIKRDLIPNLEMGAPLENGQSYSLMISEQWKGKSGGTLNQSYLKEFIVSARDSISPVATSWILNIPKANTVSVLGLDFLEALDYSLLSEVFKVRDSENQKIRGNWEIGFEEKSIQFIPDNPWKKGKYTIQIESRLEDLAGNNLNRLFEIDLLNPAQITIESDFKGLEFEIRE